MDRSMRHEWHIDEDEFRRHEMRRGRRFAYETFDPSRTCLVVIDMVRFFVDASPYVRGIVPSVNRAASALRRAGGRVAWVVPTVGAASAWDIEFYGDTVAATYAASGGESDVANRLASELDRVDGDIVLEKSGKSAFFPGHCRLDHELQSAGVTRVLIAGTVTSVCCESAVRDAAALGYEVILLADATADVSDRAHNASLRTVYRSFGDVRTVDDVSAEYT